MITDRTFGNVVQIILPYVGGPHTSLAEGVSTMLRAKKEERSSIFEHLVLI
jgi:hypothetical protein